MRRIGFGFGSPLVLLLLLAVNGPLHAQALPKKDVPPALQPWVPWALDGADEKLCPVVRGSAVCLWPGRLVLALTRSGGTFVQELQTDRALFAQLPGSARQWPQEVRLDGQAAAVAEREDRPAVWLSPGAHRVEGRFAWTRLPDSLPVPPRTALVDLAIEGRSVPFPRREEDGLLLLRQEGGKAGGEEELRLKVFRRLQDGIPLWLETQLVLEASGRAREVRLKGVLIPGAAPVAVRGDLPARLDADGALRVQVRAGRFAVSVDARLQGNPAELHRLPVETPWPTQEIWVFQGNERLRQVDVSAATPIDPSRTDLPEQWRQLPAFLMEPASVLKLHEARRGEPEPIPDQIALSRTLWLDLGGGGFSVVDQLSGTLSKTSRLNLRAPGSLGRVSVDGQDQLVTSDPASGLPGVELRRTHLALSAESRLTESASRLPAVGWDADVQSLRIALNLPPGWSLFAARGADRAPNAWVARWTLFGFFVVLLVAVAAGKLAGWRWGLVALAAQTLCYGERGRPEFVWISLLASAALLRVLREGRLLKLVKAWWGVSALLLALIALPFFLEQVRYGLYPQTAGGTAVSVQVGTEEGFAKGVDKEAALRAPPAAPEEAKGKLITGKIDSSVPQQFSNVLSRANYPGSAPAPRQQAYEQDPHAVIQTGAGLPSWRWNVDALEWSGPVSKDQRLRLFLLSPFVNLLLAFLRVALVTLFGARLVWQQRGRFRLPDHSPPEAAVPLAAAAAILLLGTGRLMAQDGGVLPDKELLDELRVRLTRPAPCSPNCVTTPDVVVTVEGSDLRVLAEVHAGAPGAWALPGPASSWVPRLVTVDRQPAALVRLSDGFLYARLSAGIHRVELAGPLPAKDSLALQFADRPRRVRANAAGWQVDGIREDGGTDGSIQLSRKLKTQTAGKETGEIAYEPWFEITRTFEIGVSWRAETVVRRISPPGVPVVLKVPLLKGMLATGEQQVKDGEVLVTFGRDQMEARWSSTIKPVEGETLALKAALERPWSEVWLLRCGSVWECTASGLPPVRRQEAGLLVSEFRPWPGETLMLSFRKPKGVEGQTVTIDSAMLDARPGRRLLDATLTLNVRASRASSLTLTLPKGAEVQTLTVKGQPKPIRPEGQRLNVTVEAGSQPVAIAWRQNEGLSILHHAPRVGLGQAAVNAQIVAHLPEGRWLLLTGGPRWGPAILFWGVLLISLLVAALLGRFPVSPLKSWQWLLLALGLSQVSIWASATVAGWFLVIAWRERWDGKPRAHDLVQLLLVLWTVVFFVDLLAAVRHGLLFQPEMQVAGNGSSGSELRWYADRIATDTPAAWFLSLPIWVYKLVMLAWSLWLAASLAAWMTWAWRAFASGGVWKPWPKKPPKQRPAPPEAAPAS